MSAKFTYYGKTEALNREVKFYQRSDKLYVCDIAGMPALRVLHPSRARVMAAFKAWWEMAQKDYGASEIDWGDMAAQEEREEVWWTQLDKQGDGEDEDPTKSQEKYEMPAQLKLL